MRQVWKTELHPGGWQEIESPPLFFGPQGDGLFVWFEHDAGSTVKPVLVRVYGTGHEISYGAEHLMSCSMPPFIWHLYTIAKEML